MNLDEKLRLIERFYGKEVASRLRRLYLISAPGEKGEAGELIDFYLAGIDPAAIPGPKEELPGVKVADIVAGSPKGYYYAGDFRLSEDLLTKHCIITGSTGSGKTNAALQLVLSLAGRVPILIFDFSKRNYRGLISALKGVRVYTLARRVAPLQFNPLYPPPNVSSTQWAKEFAEVFAHAFEIYEGGTSVILDALERTLLNKEEPVTLLDLLEEVSRYRPSSSRERDWRSSALRGLKSLCFGDTSLVFDCGRGLLPDQLLRGVTILELDGLLGNERVFVSEIVIQWLRSFLVANNYRGKLIGLILLEEAHRVLSEERARHYGGESIIERSFRELGLGLVCITQSPSKLSRVIYGNAATQLYFALDDPSDVELACRILNFDRGEFFGLLEPGLAIAKVRGLEPFMVKFPLVRLPSLGDEEVAKFMSPHIRLELRSQNLSLPGLLGVRASELDGLDWEVIRLIGELRANTRPEVEKALGLDVKARLRKLANLGFIRFVKMVEGRGKPKDFYFLSPYGEKAYLAKFGVDVCKVKVESYHSRISHKHVKERLLRKLESLGYRLKWNKVPQGVIDVVAERDNIIMPIEIETGSNTDAQLANNISKCVDNYGRAYFVVANEGVKRRVVEQAAIMAFNRRSRIVLNFIKPEEIEAWKWSRVVVWSSKL